MKSEAYIVTQKLLRFYAEEARRSRTGFVITREMQEAAARVDYDPARKGESPTRGQSGSHPIDEVDGDLESEEYELV